MRPGRDRLLTLIALERVFRAAVFLGVGVVLLTHTHTNWASTVTDFAQRLGLNTNSGGIHRILVRLHLLGPRQVRAYGAIAVAYGALEGVEGWGLFNARPWAEDLTVVATALLLVPEVWEIIKAPTVFKVLGTLVNLAVVIFLARRRRRARNSERSVGG